MIKGESICVVVAAYRAENLNNVIASISGQKLLPDRIIIVNDGQDLVREWWHNHFIDDSVLKDRVIFVDLNIRQRRFGLYGRNVGAILSRTKWVAFHDDDCSWSPDHLESLLIASKGELIPYSDMNVVGLKSGVSKVKKANFSKDNIDLGCLLWPNWIFSRYGYFKDEEDHKNAFDWALMKKVHEGEGAHKFVPTGMNTFTFTDKKK